MDGVNGDSDVNPKREKLRDATNDSMYHNFIQTPLNPEYEKLKEAIKVEHYQDNMCWINTLTDFYKNTLMDDKKREKNKLTRDGILKLIKKTEDDFDTTGASLDDMTRKVRPGPLGRSCDLGADIRDRVVWGSRMGSAWGPILEV